MLHRIITAVAWTIMAFIVFATLSPIGLRPHLESVGIERFGAFAIAALLFGLAYPRRLGLVIALIVATAALLEALQHLTPDRHGHLSDALVKISGGAFGVVAAWCIRRAVTMLMPERIASRDV